MAGMGCVMPQQATLHPQQRKKCNRAHNRLIAAVILRLSFFLRYSHGLCKDSAANGV